MLDTLEDFYFIYLYIIWKSINIPIFILFYFILFYFNIYIYIIIHFFFMEVIYFYPYLVLITLVFLSRTSILYMYLNMLLTKKNVWIDSRSDKSKSKSFLATLLDVCNLATCDSKILLFYVLNIRYLSFYLL